MNYDQCPYSGRDIPLNERELAQSYYVECPECGAIRTVTEPKSIGGKTYRLYPVHNTLIGTSRSRPQWWKQDRVSKSWQLISE